MTSTVARVSGLPLRPAAPGPGRELAGVSEVLVDDGSTRWAQGG